MLGAVLPPGADLPQGNLLNSCRRTRLDLYMLWNMFIVTIAIKRHHFRSCIEVTQLNDESDLLARRSIHMPGVSFTSQAFHSQGFHSQARRFVHATWE